MKHACTVLALGLVLVFALASTVPAGIIRGEDYDNPGNGPGGGGGGEDDDHPWGGDKIIGGGGDGDSDGVYEKRVRTSSLTGYFLIDLILQKFAVYYDRNDSGVISSGSGGSALTGTDDGPDRSGSSGTALSSPLSGWKVEKR